MPVCPICKGKVEARGKNGAFPFCSPRCKQVDLGNWLDEAYRVPVTGQELDELVEEQQGHPKQEDA
jgi:endogenous inhibitor of DNA gyrase (YacG/DUF329 family)